MEEANPRQPVPQVTSALPAPSSELNILAPLVPSTATLDRLLKQPVHNAPLASSVPKDQLTNMTAQKELLVAQERHPFLTLSAQMDSSVLEGPAHNVSRAITALLDQFTL